MASHSPRDEAGIDAEEFDELTHRIAELELGWLPKWTASLQVAFLKAPLQLIGGVGVLVFAFGDFGRSSGELTLNPNFPTGVPGLVVIFAAATAIIKSFTHPITEFVWWKGRQRRSVKYWGREVVDHVRKCTWCAK